MEKESKDEVEKGGMESECRWQTSKTTNAMDIVNDPARKHTANTNKITNFVIFDIFTNSNNVTNHFVTNNLFTWSWTPFLTDVMDITIVITEENVVVVSEGLESIVNEG